MADLTVAELRQHRAALIRLRADGVRELVDQNGERVVFRSDRELAAAIAAVDSEIAALTAARPNKYLFRTSKGI